MREREQNHVTRIYYFLIISEKTTKVPFCCRNDIFLASNIYTSLIFITLNTLCLRSLCSRNIIDLGVEYIMTLNYCFAAERWTTDLRNRIWITEMSNIKFLFNKLFLVELILVILVNYKEEVNRQINILETKLVNYSRRLPDKVD